MIAATILITFAGFSSSIALVGREARLVDVLTIFFTGFGGGAALIDAVRAMADGKARRQNTSAPNE